jgi:hypothetical protein
MAQESTFTAEIRSHANAYGLMQIIPGTGRRYARKLGISGFKTAMLRQPEINVRIGTQYFRDLIDRFGGAHFALASYNAGESRVDRWTGERPGIPQDELIDDILPRRPELREAHLGTAEDYRALYGGECWTEPALVAGGGEYRTGGKAPAPSAPPRRRRRQRSRPVGCQPHAPLTAAKRWTAP